MTLTRPRKTSSGSRKSATGGEEHKLKQTSTRICGRHYTGAQKCVTIGQHWVITLEDIQARMGRSECLQSVASAN